MLLSSTRYRIACHSSLERIGQSNLESGIANISFSISLKNTSKEELPLGGFQEDLCVNEGVLLNSKVDSLRKYYLRRIFLQSSSKSFCSSGSFVLLWIGA